MYYLGLDIGSSSVKAALVEASTGKHIISLNEPAHEMSIQSIKNDWAEQDPKLWWQNVCTVIKRVISEAKIEASKIAAVGIAYQMHGLVIVDKKGLPLRPAIIWCDSRAASIGTVAYHDLGHDTCSEKLLNSPGNFTVSKLKWVKDNEPDIYSKIDKFMLPGDYIAYKLSHTINTTINGLSEGILWDYQNHCPAKWLLDYYGIDQNLMPDIIDNFTQQGVVSKSASKDTGLPEGIPITYRAGDQPNNALALNIFKPGEVAATCGTSGVLYAVTDTLKSKEVQRINNFVHVNYTKQKPILGKLLCINGAGIQYRWLRNNTGKHTYEHMNSMAEKIPIGSEGLSVLPFGNGVERMLNNNPLGTHFCNLNLNIHKQAHLYRAALEGIAFAFVYGMEILTNDNFKVEVIRAGNDNLFQSEVFSNTLSTLIGHNIEIYNSTGAVGAARAAGLTNKDFDAFGANVIKNDHVKTYKPSHDAEPYQVAYAKWKNQLEILLQNTI